MSAPWVCDLTVIASRLAAIAINSLWEGAFIVACVWLFMRAWPKLNAATRYIVWSVSLAAIVVVPIVTTIPFLSFVPVSAQAWKPSPAMPAAAAPVAHTAAALGRSLRPAIGSTHTTIPVAPQSEPEEGFRVPPRMQFTLPLPVSYAIVGLWLVLALVALVRLALGLRSLEHLKRDALPLPVEYRDAMARWTAANKGSREVRLCVSDEIDVPVAVGLFDSMILIPRDLLERLSQAEVDQISLHELAHLRRADDWSNGLQRIAIALLGWNPAVRLAGAQMDLEREVACDDWVLSLTGSVRPYAVCLTKMAETSSWPRRTIPAPGVFATRKHISLRIERLLGAGRNVATNLSIGPAAAALAIVGALAFAMQLVAPSIAAPFIAPEEKMNVEATASASPAAMVTTAKGTDVHVPGIDVHVPAANVVVPATTVHIPATSIHLPKTDVHVAGMTVHLPSPPASELAKQIETSVNESIAQGENAAAQASRAAGHATRGQFRDWHQVADASSVRNCSGCDMSGANWSGRDMHGVDYTGVDLSRSTLTHTNFSGGNFNGVDFSRSDLTGADFRGAHLTGCDFSRANLTGVDFSGASISGCQFTGATLTSSEVRSILDTCTGCDFSHANLAHLDLTGVRTNGIDFSNADLEGADLSNAEFTGVDFSRAKLSGANLNGTTLNGCDLSDVDLSHVDLSHAKLVGTDFSAHGKANGSEPPR